MFQRDFTIEKAKQDSKGKVNHLGGKSRLTAKLQNESFNAQIWKRAPKHLPISKKSVECAVSMAVLDFNIGPRGFSNLLQKMDIEECFHLHQHSLQNSHKRRLTSVRHASTPVKRK